MTDPMLRADCARCAALCCVGLAFDRSALFAFDKAANEVCPHLTAGHHCGIHSTLPHQGFAGCARYDCLGAGQRVTQELFAGRSWRDDSTLRRPMLEAFRAMRHVHELLQLLRTCQALPLTVEQEQRRNELHRQMLPPHGWSPKTLTAFEQGSLPSEIQHFLVSLREQVQPRQRRRTLPMVRPLPMIV